MHNLNYLHDLLILLLASVVIVIVFRQLRLSPVLGYLVAGAAIGPFGFGILTSIETTGSIAELGIVFLLFAIGLELTFTHLISLRKYVLGFGGLQILLTSTVIFLICNKFFKLSQESSIIIGMALSLSSTAIVMQVINEGGEQSTRVGRLSFAILLMQDLVVIPILVLLPIFAQSELENISAALGNALLKAIIAMAIIFIVGRLLLRPVYRLIAEAKNETLFLSFTLAVIFGSAFVSNYMGLSFALGAFVAGLMVAETEYKYHVEEEISSIKALLLGLFFMTIGMSFDFDLLVRSFPHITAVACGIIVIKCAVIMLLCRIFRLPFAPSIHTGLLLSQGGEFAFVVFLIAVQKRFMDHDLSQFLMTTVTFTMALTPLLAMFGAKIKNRLYIKEILHDSKLKKEIGDISKHVIIVGFSKIGRIVAYILRRRGIEYIVLDNNHRIVRIEKNNGYNIHYGDPTSIDILRYVGIEKAESIIITLEDEIACIKVTRFIRDNFPNVSIITKAESINNLDRFKKLGANFVVLKGLETGLQLSQMALASVGVDNNEITKAIQAFRDIKQEVVKDIIFSGEEGGEVFEKAEEKSS